MKYQAYIEEIVFNSPPVREQEQFNRDILNNPVLKEEYEAYLEILELISRAELKVTADASSLEDFVLDPQIDIIVLCYKEERANDKFSEQIRRIIFNNTCKHNNPRKGWLKGAAVFTIIALCLSVYLYVYLPGVNIHEADISNYMPMVFEDDKLLYQDITRANNFILKMSLIHLLNHKHQLNPISMTSYSIPHT